MTRRPLRTNLFRPSLLLPSFLPSFLLDFFFFPFFFSHVHAHAHAHAHAPSLMYTRTCTHSHTQSPAQLFMGSRQVSRGGKTGGVRSRPPSPPHPTPPHPTAREPPCPFECFGVKSLKSRPAPEERSAPPSFSVPLKAGREENLLPRRGRCQGTVAVSTHVRDPHTRERGFLGYQKEETPLA